MITKEQRQAILNKYGGRCAYTGKPLGDNWQVDHVHPRSHSEWQQPGASDPDNIDNLLPAMRIVNHYKRGHTLESFRMSMMKFHVRLKKLPKKTMVAKTKKRIVYMNTVADLFEIKIDKPFNGKFYFETLKNIP